ncbi:MAG: hydrolase [Kiloniellaceae bacterium]
MVPPAPDIKGSGLIVVDVQERLAPAIAGAPAMVTRIAALIEKAKESGIPILATEQYSRGLGPTVLALRARLPAADVVEKIHFAASREPAFVEALRARGVRHAVVAGMEAHVCVLQTALGLLAEGLAVTLVADAVASRAAVSRDAALARLARAGARLADSHALLAEWAPAALSGRGESPTLSRPA